MKASIEVESITPEVAAELLATSYGNRPINKPTVLEYAVIMDSDKWSPTASKIDLDEKGRLVNGHHRLEAVILAQKTVKMLVHRGVPTQDRDVIDTGRARTLSDIAAMYTKKQNVAAWCAALQVCVKLVTRGAFNRPKIKSLDMAERWERLFQEGLDFAVPFGSGPGYRAHTAFRNGYVTGALAFAYKRNPNATKTFAKQMMLGESITADMPSYVVRTAVMHNAVGNRNKSHKGGGGVHEMTFKILSGLYATIKGTSYKTAQAGREGYLYFLESYDTTQVKAMLEPYLRFTKEREAQIKALEAKTRDANNAVGRRVAA